MREASINRPSYFLFLSIVGVLAVLIGFAKTFFIPVSAGTFSAPLSVHVHGAFAFAWIFLFLLQNLLVSWRKLQPHRTLGYAGIFIAMGVMITMFPVGVFSVDRELAHDDSGAAYSSMLGVVISGLLFFALVIAGLMTRRRPDYHKRYMLLATIVVLWPAWFRFRHYFPSVPNPEIWFALVLADSLIVISWAWEWIQFRRIHPVILWGGLFVIAEQTIEVMAFDSPAWRMAATWLYNTCS